MFNLTTNINELKSSPVISGGYKQYPPSRDVTGNNFTNGTQIFRWEGSNSEWYLPSKSYIRYRLKVTGPDGVSTPKIVDDVGLSMNTCANFYQSMDYKINGTTISRVSDYVAQIDTLKKRLNHSQSHINSVLDSIGNWTPEFRQRQSHICEDGYLVDKSTATGEQSMPYSKQALGLDDTLGAQPDDRNGLSYDADTNIFTLHQNNGQALPAGPIVQVGDFIVYQTIQGAGADDDRLNVLVRITGVIDDTHYKAESGILLADVANDGRSAFFKVTMRQNLDNEAKNKNEVELIWTPSLSIFDVDHCIPMCGKQELSLNPHSSSAFNTRVVQSLLANQVAGTDFKVEVVDMYLYIYTVQGPAVDNTSFLLDLDECQIQAEKIDSTNFSQKNLDVSPSTRALTVLFQDQRSSADTRVSDSLFKSYNAALSNVDHTQVSEDLKLSRFYLNFAGTNYPSPDADPSFDITKDHTTQRYLESLSNSGSWYDNGGSESIQEWQRRGTYHHFQVHRAPTDKSTRCTVHTQFNGADVTNMRLLLACHHKNVVRIEIQNGRVKTVQQAEI